MITRCAICGDGYGTRYICPRCRAEPANHEWRESSEREVGFSEVLDVPAARAGVSARSRVLTPKQEQVVRLLAAGKTAAEAAQIVGCTPQYVRTVARRANLKRYQHLM